MRNKLVPVLLGVGAFLIVAAALLRFYAYPQLAVAPIDQDSESLLVGPGATVFDVGTLSEIQTDLTTSAKTVGDIAASEEAEGNTRVWVNTSSTTNDAGEVLSRSVERAAFDAHTGEAVNCCGEFYSTVEGEQTPVEHKGLLFKFPFRTDKNTTYDWWDSTLLEPVPISYDRTEVVAGYETLVFEQSIDPTVTSTTELPASLLGEEGDDTLEADRVYSNIRTLWVEPNTGVILKRTEQQDNYLAYDGERKITTTKVTTGFTEQTTQEFADEYGKLGTLLNLAYTVLPISFLLLGVLALAGGVLLMRRSRTSAHAA